MSGGERAERAERERDVAAAEPDREDLPVALVGRRADPGAADDAGRDDEPRADAEAAEGLEAGERARGHGAEAIPPRQERPGRERDRRAPARCGVSIRPGS